MDSTRKQPISRSQKEETISDAQQPLYNGQTTCWGRGEERKKHECKAGLEEQHSHRPIMTGERDYVLMRQEARMRIAAIKGEMKTAEIVALLGD